ncbi:MAG: SIS domain-containing protein [Gaiellaceae bacterium]
MPTEDEHVRRYLGETAWIAERIDATAVEGIVRELLALRTRGGRLFLAGSGGGAGHASHAAADFRKLGGFEAYAIADNVSELTARVNDEGWESSYVEWLRGSRLGAQDLLFVLSVGGGDAERGISANLVACVDYARELGVPVCGIVGRDGGHTARHAAACVVVPVRDTGLTTAHTEGFQAVLWHLLVADPRIQMRPMRWEQQAVIDSNSGA